jgi:hypothetical protein
MRAAPRVPPREGRARVVQVSRARVCVCLRARRGGSGVGCSVGRGAMWMMTWTFAEVCVCPRRVRCGGLTRGLRVRAPRQRGAVVVAGPREAQGGDEVGPRALPSPAGLARGTHAPHRHVLHGLLAWLLRPPGTHKGLLAMLCAPPWPPPPAV